MLLLVNFWLWSFDQAKKRTQLEKWILIFTFAAFVFIFGIRYFYIESDKGTVWKNILLKGIPNIYYQVVHMKVLQKLWVMHIIWIQYLDTKFCEFFLILVLNPILIFKVILIFKFYIKGLKQFENNYPRSCGSDYIFFNDSWNFLLGSFT